MNVQHWRRWLVTGICLLGGVLSIARGQQAKYPPLPDRFRVLIHYRIDGGPETRFAGHEALLDRLKQLGFEADAREDADLDAFDPKADTLRGTISSAKAVDILRDDRVLAIAVSPADLPPAGEGKKLKVVLHLRAGLLPRDQQILSDQTKELLLPLGFEEDIGYDHRGYSRLRGLLPAGVVPSLVRDIRSQGTGWLLPDKLPREFPQPLRSISPIRMVQVLREAESSPAIPSALPPAPSPQYVKLSGDIRRALAVDGGGSRPARIEVIMDHEPGEGDFEYRRAFARFGPQPFIEGRFGNILTLKVDRLSQAGDLAILPFVVGIRFPPAAPSKAAGAVQRDVVLPRGSAAIRPVSFEEAPFDILRATRLNWLHANGSKGRGIRIVMVAEDFAGLGQYIGMGLPRETKVVDMTGLRNTDLIPDPVSNEAVGAGVVQALAAAQAAPEAQFTLVRIDAGSPHLALDMAKSIVGDAAIPDGIKTLRERLDSDTQIGNVERQRALAEYQRAFDDFSEDEGPQKRRAAARAGLLATEKQQAELLERALRLGRLEEGLRNLKGANVVISAVGWSTGYPLDGASPLSRYLEENFIKNGPPIIKNAAKLPKPPLWFQAAGDERGQKWSGSFLDEDGNGAMEFGPTVPPTRWTRELNFIGYRPYGAAAQPDLPAKGVMKITLQWTEPHDSLFSPNEYRDPIADLKLVLLRQLDPNSEKMANDELEVAGVSEGPAELIRLGSNFGVYERTVTVALATAGRYALRIEGRIPTSTKPTDAPSLEPGTTRWDLKPNIAVESLDAAGRAAGQYVFLDFESVLGGVGMPADSRGAIAVGAMNARKQPTAISSVGAGAGLELRVKPDILMYDAVPNLPGTKRGTPAAAAFAGGMAASMLGAGASQSWFLMNLKIAPGGYFEVPEFWFKK